jgi:hypothetical protein
VTSKPPCYGSISEFSNFIKDIEEKWKNAPYLRSTYGSLNWTLSDDGYFIYGNGAKNLELELPKHSRVAIGGVMQGCFGEHYDRTCFLIIFAYRILLTLRVSHGQRSIHVNQRGFWVL